MKRKILGTAMALGMCAMIPFTTAIAANNVLMGDLDLDGELTVNDALTLARLIKGMDGIVAEQSIRSDFNGDGVVNVKDVHDIMKHIDSNFIVGDANRDGKITQEDVDIVNNIVKGKTDSTYDRIDKQIVYLDYNEDGKIDILDVTKINLDAKKKGDVNKDEVVDEKDALEIARIVAAKEEITDELILRADVNRDGEVNAKDAHDLMKSLNPNFMLGDADGDGKITQTDVDVVNNITKGKTDSTYNTPEKQVLYLDYNEDGKVTILDVIQLNLIVKTKGDVNSDGVVNVEDAGAVLDIYKGNIELTDTLLFRGDMNDDGVINVEDAGLILDKYKGLI